MAVRMSITVFCIFIIITTFYSFGGTAREIRIIIYYNRVYSDGCIKTKEKGVCYYKDGDVLNVICAREGFENSNKYQRVYHCKKNWTESDQNWNQCSATEPVNQNIVSDRLNLTEEHDKNVVLCEFYDAMHMSRKLWKSKLLLQPDQPPTIIISDVYFNKSLSKPNIYEGQIGENLKIVCKRNENTGTLEWDYCKDLNKGKALYEPPCPIQKKYGKENVYANLELTQKLNGTEIKCVYNNVNQRQTITSVIFNLQPDSGANFIGSLYFCVTVGVGTLIIIILIIITVNLYVCRKSGQNMGEEEITYENLSSEIPIPPTFPNSAKLEEIYLKPSACPESDSGISDNDAYTLPHVETNIEYLYSKPIPKTLRSSKPKNLEKSIKNIKTNEPSYADIETFTNNDSVRSDNTEYATVNFNPNYSNVFVNETYDHAESTYCEIRKSVK